MPVTTMLAIVFITMGMGRKPPAKPAAEPKQKREAGTTLSRKARLAAMEGKTRSREDVGFMGSAEQDIYRAHVEQMRDINPESHVIMQYLEERVVKVGLDSNYAVVVESKSYIVTEEGRDTSGCLGGYFIEGSLYALDTLQRVLWRRYYDNRGKPLYGQGLLLTAFGEKYILVEVPDTSGMADEYSRLVLLLDYKGRELRRILSGNSPKLTSKGKYYRYTIDVDDIQTYKEIICNLQSRDSVIIIGGLVGYINDDSGVMEVQSTYYLHEPHKIKYSTVKGRTIDMRR
ncbi:MAG: hypothetical protein EG824_11490 [Deltaproteobacteria bacterium]|nr:hypothetical protein [Deltaproteobacteria bacterium]